MKVFWSKIIKPLLHEIQPKNIVEIGSEDGLTTKNILEQYCLNSDAHLTVIDPKPRYNPGDWMNLYKPHLSVLLDLSLKALPNVKDYDVVFIDGDHNWYTVFNELKIIEQYMVEKTAKPIIIMHDVSWPCARRDLYYSIDDIPVQYRQPHAKKGVFPGISELLDLGFNAGVDNAIHEGGERNGVLTAVEDFLAQTSFNFSFHKLECYHGLGILVPENPTLDFKIKKIFLQSGMDKYQKKEKEINTSDISLCMIVKNEEDTLERCLNSVKEIVDEIIIVDTGSTDKTKEIASAFTNKVIDFTWVNDFSAARNFAFSKATKEYILWLDADDFITVDNLELLLKLKHKLSSSVDSVLMKYHLKFDEKGKPTYSTERNRLVRRDRNFKWIGSVHEYLEVYGNILYSDIGVHHTKVNSERDQERNLKIYRKQLENGHKLSARDLFYYGNELLDHSYDEEALKIYEEFLQTDEGWIEDKISACIRMADISDRLHETAEQISSLLRSFMYDKPRAEICCKLGEVFHKSNNIDRAIFWYELATTLECPAGIKGLSYDASAWTWLPHLQLCVCYDKLGDLTKAIYHNNKALKYNPDHPSMLYNQNYFLDKLKINNGTK